MFDGHSCYSGVILGWHSCGTFFLLCCFDIPVVVHSSSICLMSYGCPRPCFCSSRKGSYLSKFCSCSHSCISCSYYWAMSFNCLWSIICSYSTRSCSCFNRICYCYVNYCHSSCHWAIIGSCLCSYFVKIICCCCYLFTTMRPALVIAMSGSLLPFLYPKVRFLNWCPAS